MSKTEIRIIFKNEELEPFYVNPETFGDIEGKFRREIKNERRKSFELACFLFKQEFSKENLKKYIKELNDIEFEYQKKSKEEGRRLSLLSIFTEMSILVEQQE